ncbi:Protein transport protein Sec16A [Lucilia cuprina]|nr:Protein transport protein Sec16A [Lucilia cuprina]
METTIYAKQLITNNAEKYRGSYTLMWNLLILLLKQNGMVVGTDIAELLLKNQQQYPYQTPISTANNSLKSKSGSNSSLEVDKEEDLTKDLAAETDTKEDNNVQATLEENKLEQEDLTAEDNTSNSVTLSEEEITEKFRNYLLYGNVNEALEWATDNNLWGHALFLASKLDRRSHANVMMKFANKLSLNDPLQTLYQLMSGRTPSSVTCVQDEKWGDWRPHLSMILSNTSQKPELDRKAITTLGDSLFNRGDLYAAHFCYLMAQVGFGRYQESATQETSLQQHLPKLVLLGSSHYKQFPEFAHNEAIVMTEIYEYACSLNDDKFSIVEFQPYKFLLATRLLDYGFHLKSLMYLEQIAVHIARDPSKYESSFINKVYEMADRLKYYDPVLEKTIDDQQQGSEDVNGLNLTPQQMEEQKWLQNLRQLAQQYQNDLQNSNTNALQDPQQQQQQQQQLTQDPNYYHNQQKIDQQFMEINKQFSELNLQYQQQPPAVSTTTEQQQQQQPITYYNPEQPTQMGDSIYGYQQPTTTTTTTTQSLQPELPTDNAKDLQPTDNTNEIYQQSGQYLQSSVEPIQQQQQTQHTTDYSNNYYDPTAQYNATDSGINNMETTTTAAAPAYDYWGQQSAHMPQVAEEPELNANNNNPNDMVLLKQTHKMTSTLKANNINHVTLKAPLNINNKKSPLKLKSNISTYTSSPLSSTPIKDKLKTTTTTTKTPLSAKKTLDLVQHKTSTAAATTRTTTTTTATATAFNKLANSTEHNNNMIINSSTTSISSSATPFSINNVSNLNKQSTTTTTTTTQVAAAFNNNNHCNAKQAKNNIILKSLKLNKTSAILKSPAKHNENNLNDLSLAGTQIKKVNFIIPSDLPENTCSSSNSTTSDNNEKLLKDSKLMLKYEQQQQQQQKLNNNAQDNNNMYRPKQQIQHARFLNKNIVYNGTFPIDMPLQTRFNNYDPEANCTAQDLRNYEVYESSSNDEEDDHEEDYEEQYDDDNEQLEDEEEAETSSYLSYKSKTLASSLGIITSKSQTQKPPQVWSLKELINDPSIPFNYKKMCNEVEQSLQQFEDYIDAKALNEEKNFKMAHNRQAPNARPTISMPKSKTYDTDEDSKQQHTAGNEGNKKQQQQAAQQQQQQQQQKAAENQQQSNQNSGWFGGIWNKFSLKPKNQMILPDDKNPSIVWDPEKKKWVNTDGDEDAQEALKPPPKMSDLMPQTQMPPQQQQPQQQQQQQQNQQQPQIPFMDPQQMQQQQPTQLPQQYVPNSIPNPAPSPSPLQQQQQQTPQNPSQIPTQAPGPAKTPTLQSNMFKMQRNRTLKNAYVDVFNPSGAPVNKAAENILAPALPPAAVPQGRFFIPGVQPGAAAVSGSSGQEQQYQQQTQQSQQQDVIISEFELDNELVLNSFKLCKKWLFQQLLVLIIAS